METVLMEDAKRKMCSDAHDLDGFLAAILGWYSKSAALLHFIGALQWTED